MSMLHCTCELLVGGERSMIKLYFYLGNLQLKPSGVVDFSCVDETSTAYSMCLLTCNVYHL